MPVHVNGTCGDGARPRPGGAKPRHHTDSESAASAERSSAAKP
jgi:hypothetical protein